MSHDSVSLSSQPFFGHVHAPNIHLEDNGWKISRKPGTYNGLAFSKNPLQIGERITMVIERDQNCNGDLRIGLTSNDPANISQLPKYSCPMLCGLSGYWLAGVPLSSQENKIKITFYVTGNGSLQLFTNGNHKGALLSKLPLKDPLWFTVDLFGKSTSLTVIKDDDVPVEVISRGPEAVAAYKQVISTGCVPMYRGRLMIVGPKGSGKTSLKNLLVKTYISDVDDSCRKTTEEDLVIDTTIKCVIGESKDGANYPTWQSMNNFNLALNASCEDNKYEEESSLSLVLEYEKNLEDEYQKAIAKNIVTELLQQKKLLCDRKRSSSGKNKQLYINRKSLTWRKNKDGGRKGLSLDRKCDECRTNQNDLPDQIADLVEKLLQEAEVKQDWDKMENEKQNRKSTAQINLSVWDWSGDKDFFVIQQAFFSPRAMYLVVYDLTRNFGELCDTTQVKDSGQDCYLNEIQFWLQAIYNHASCCSRSAIYNRNSDVKPKILLVGTHKNQIQADCNLARDKIVDSKFNFIMNSLKDKPYFDCVENKMHVLDICDNFSVVETNVSNICNLIEELFYAEWYMGEEIPLPWLAFDNSIHRLIEAGTYGTDISKLRTVAESNGITLEENVNAMLLLFHDLGTIVYFGNVLGSIDESLANYVILSPDWLMRSFQACLLLRRPSATTESYLKVLEHEGRINGSALCHAASELEHQLPLVLSLMKKFELLYEMRQLSESMGGNVYQNYIVPTRVKAIQEMNKNEKPYMVNTITFYFVFKGFIFDSVFGKLVVRAMKWLHNEVENFITLHHHLIRLCIDNEHDLKMRLIPNNRIKVTIIRVLHNFNSSTAKMDKDGVRMDAQKKPVPETCAAVRHFIESSLEDIRVMWEKRMAYQTCVACWCSKDCSIHNKKLCTSENCVHFLPLDECLINKVVCCDYQRLKTGEIKSWFPEVLKPANRKFLKPQVLFGANRSVIRKAIWDLDVIPNPDLPDWANSAAKFLNASSEGQDWAALAAKLGYKKKKITDFQDDFNPALTLITDWIQSSGNTKLSTDMMLSCLEEMNCSEIISLIKSGSADKDPSPIFISYQWDIQDEVLLIRNHLEVYGYSCWMDVGQMGGGDLLYQQIYDGISNCKVMICCVSPKYVVSNVCSREVSLADALNKPMIPVMVETTAWPPLGAMGLYFSQLIYVSMCENGGHGGSGKHSDWQTRMQEIVLQVSRYISSPVNLQSDSSFIRINNLGSKRELQFHVDEVHGALPNPADQPDPSSMESTNSSNANPRNISPPFNRLQQPVHVSNCAICTIL